MFATRTTKVEGSILDRTVQRTPQLRSEAATVPTFAPSSGSQPDFSRIPIHASNAGAVQTKLAINEAGDEYEQEADRVAARVMQAPEPQLQRACAGGGSCSRCQTEMHGHQRFQMKRVALNDLSQTAVPPIVHEVLRSPGHPLDPATRSFMEPRFGHDFSHVRVHFGADANQSAEEFNAYAYTLGHDIVFGADRFAPGTLEGQRLLAHELTHVVQQREGRTFGIRRSFASCQHLLADEPNALEGLISGSAAHSMIAADFMQKAAGARRVIIPGGSAAPLRSQGLCGASKPVIDPQIVGGKSGAGLPDLARITSGGVLQVAEIKPASSPCLVDGEEQALRYIDQGNAPDAAQTAWRESLGVRVVSPMLESAYTPPNLAVMVPAVGSAQLESAWCEPGLLAYTVKGSMQSPPPLPVPAWDALLKTILATAAGAIALKKLSTLLPGRPALAFAAGLIVLLEGKKLSFAGENDPLEAIFNFAQKSGQPIPADLQKAIREDKALSDLLSSSAKTSDYAEVRRKLAEEFTRLIIENRDKFTDADLQELAKLAEQNQDSIHTGPITVEALRCELNAIKARGGEPRPETPTSQASAAGAPPPTHDQSRLPALPDDLRRRLAADKAASALVEELTVEEGAGTKIDGSFVKEILRIVLAEKLTVQDVKHIAEAVMVTTGKGATAAERLTALKRAISSLKAAKEEAASPASSAPTETGGMTSGTVDPAKQVAAEKAAADAKLTLKEPDQYKSVEEGMIRMLGRFDLPAGLKIRPGDRLPAIRVVGRRRGQLFLSIVTPTAFRRVTAYAGRWTVMTDPVPAYDADGKKVGVLPSRTFDLDFNQSKTGASRSRK